MKKQIVGALMAAASLLPMAAAAQERGGRGDRGDRGGRAERVQAREARQAQRVEQRQQRPQAQPQQRAERIETQPRANFQAREARRAGNELRGDQRQMRFLDRRNDGPIGRQRLAGQDRRDDAQRQNPRWNAQRWTTNDSGDCNRAQERREDRREDRRDVNNRRDDRNNWYNRSQFDQQRNYRNQRGNYQSQRGNWNRGWRNDRRYDWNNWRQSNRNAFRLPRYYAPYGWNRGYRRFGVGAVLSQVLFAQNYWIDDPYSYRLPQAYEPYQWVRYYNDALLVDTYSGEVVDVIEGIFW